MAEVPLPLQCPTLSYSPQLCWLQCNANQHPQKRERSCRGKAASGTGWATSTWGARSHKCEVIKAELLFFKSVMHWLARTIPKLLTTQRVSTREEKKQWDFFTLAYKWCICFYTVIALAYKFTRFIFLLDI